ncbi:MAG: DAK2 domain-containing protein [Roseiflexaceae bacterium]|nr:DAK2 domain-containing protein [Roseiflexus sp.]MDW8212398.1 DAK2 domain-containing protein [Roseiflexaceae bacterium]
MTGAWNGEHLLEALRTASRDLERHAASLNALNVFPVPDGDTGTNMALTLSGALRDITPHPSCSVVAERVGYWATMRGRGNSGIILSQILRGVATALAGHHLMSGRELAAALAHGSARAYEAVLRPVEGTMLTVIRCAGEAAQRAIAAGEASVSAVLDAAVREARAAVMRTPQLLATLREAGVVDAGGQGLLVLLEALLRYARGETGELHAPAVTPAAIVDDHAGSAGYCTSFVIHKAIASLDAIRRVFAALGDSLVVAGDQALVKVHLHTPRPGDALNQALEFGALDQIEVVNMDLQRAARDAGEALPADPLPAESVEAPTAPGIIALASGAGYAAILRDLGADLVWETTALPTIDEWRAALERLPQRDILVLPNDPQAVETAQAAARQVARRVEVVPTTSPPQGIAALLALNFQAEIDQNVQTMTAAAERVRVITFNWRQGNKPETPAEMAQDAYNVCHTLRQIGASDAEVATLYYSQGIDDAQAAMLAETIRAAFPALHVDMHASGQPGCDIIIALE